MACFPLYVELENRCCLVVGGGTVAYRKIKQLMEFGAVVKVVTREATDQICKLFEEDKIELHLREFQSEDVDGMTIVVVATDDSQLNKNVSCLCREKGIPVNVVDKRELCTFFFSSIIKQEQLVVSISTGGASPLIAAELKEKIKDEISEDYVKATVVMGKYREYIREKVENQSQRKKVYRRLLDMALQGDKTISYKDVDRLLENIEE